MFKLNTPMPTPNSYHRTENQSAGFPRGLNVSPRSNDSGLPLWFRLLPTDLQEELHQNVIAIVTKPDGPIIKESVVELQQRFQLSEAQVFDLINRYRIELSPSVNGNVQITDYITHNVPPISIGVPALQQREKILQLDQKKHSL